MILEDKKPFSKAGLLAWIALTLIGLIVLLLRHRGIIQ